MIIESNIDLDLSNLPGEKVPEKLFLFAHDNTDSICIGLVTLHCVSTSYFVLLSILWTLLGFKIAYINGLNDLNKKRNSESGVCNKYGFF